VKPPIISFLLLLIFSLFSPALPATASDGESAALNTCVFIFYQQGQRCAILRDGEHKEPPPSTVDHNVMQWSYCVPSRSLAILPNFTDIELPSNSIIGVFVNKENEVEFTVTLTCSAPEDVHRLVNQTDEARRYREQYAVELKKHYEDWRKGSRRRAREALFREMTS